MPDGRLRHAGQVSTMSFWISEQHRACHQRHVPHRWLQSQSVPVIGCTRKWRWRSRGTQRASDGAQTTQWHPLVPGKSKLLQNMSHLLILSLTCRNGSHTGRLGYGACGRHSPPQLPRLLQARAPPRSYKAIFIATCQRNGVESSRSGISAWSSYRAMRQRQAGVQWALSLEKIGRPKTQTHPGSNLGLCNTRVSRNRFPFAPLANNWLLVMTMDDDDHFPSCGTRRGL